MTNLSFGTDASNIYRETSDSSGLPNSDTVVPAAESNIHRNATITLRDQRDSFKQLWFDEKELIED